MQGPHERLKQYLAVLSASPVAVAGADRPERSGLIPRHLGFLFEQELDVAQYRVAAIQQLEKQAFGAILRKTLAGQIEHKLDRPHERLAGNSNLERDKGGQRFERERKESRNRTAP